MKVFVLFQTDVWETKSSRVCCGVFDSFEKANKSAKENDLYTNDAEVVIIETELNNFEEL
jgi:hypothetical protein